MTLSRLIIVAACSLAIAFGSSSVAFAAQSEIAVVSGSNQVSAAEAVPVSTNEDSVQSDESKNNDSSIVTDSVKSLTKPVEGNDEEDYREGDGGVVVGLAEPMATSTAADAVADLTPESQVDSSTPTYGWVQKEEDTYYYVKGVPITGSYWIKGSWYFFDLSDGHMLTGSQNIDGNEYWYDEITGALTFGSRYIDGSWYRYDLNDGHMLTGSQYIDGNWYWFDLHTGAMFFGSCFIDGNWYRYDLRDGHMLSGGCYIDGNWYWYDLDAGYMHFGATYIDGNWYWYDLGTGKMLYGWQTINADICYYNRTDGKLALGVALADDKMRYFNPLSGNYEPGNAQTAIVHTALSGNTFGLGPGLCQAWIEAVYDNAVGPQPQSFCAYEAWTHYGISTSRYNIPLGAVIYGHSNPFIGDALYNDYGHVAIYMPGDIVADLYIGRVRYLTFDEWVDDHGFFGWGWQGGYAID